MRLLLVAILMSLAATSARAATVEFDFIPKSPSPKSYASSTFKVTGDVGSDDLDLRWSGGLLATPTLDVVDRTRPVTARAARSDADVLCSEVDAHHVRCAPRGLIIVRVDGGEGDDRLALDGGYGILTFVSGGAGDDVLHAGVGDAWVDGGLGDDEVDGGPGDDTVVDGPGRDLLRGGEGDDVLTTTGDRLGDGDLLDGGAGDDTLRVTAFRDGSGGPVPDEPVEVDLEAGLARSLHGTTTVTDVRNASVDIRGSVVRGDDGPNALSVVGGVIDGRGGDDRLHAAGLAHVSCGAGQDVATLEVVPRPLDCEGTTAWFGFLGSVTVRGRAVAVGIAPHTGLGCGTRVRASSVAGRSVTAAIRTRGLGPTTVRLPLRGKRAPAVVVVAVEIAFRCPRGRPWQYASSEDVRAPAVALR